MATIALRNPCAVARLAGKTGVSGQVVMGLVRYNGLHFNGMTVPLSIENNAIAPFPEVIQRRPFLADTNLFVTYGRDPAI